MRAMRLGHAGFVAALALSLVALTGQRAAAKCDPTGADKADVAAARAAVDLHCNCAGVANHGKFVSCAADEASKTLTNKSCHGVVVKCAARSTCGKPGFVTCCRTKASGVTSCSTKSNSDKCTPPKGGTACVGSFPSCCDACTSSGCATSPSGAFVD